MLGYDDFWDAVRVEKTLVSDAIRKRLSQGIQLGIEQRKTEEKAVIARNLKQMGMPSKTICDVTSLSAEAME